MWMLHEMSNKIHKEWPFSHLRRIIWSSPSATFPVLVWLQKSFGIRGTVLQWFNSYLSQRTQFVNISETNFAGRDLSLGVPQGSILVPVYSTAPLAKVIRSYVQVQVQVYCRISLYNTFFNLHCSQLAIASRGEQWLDVYTRENK